MRMGLHPCWNSLQKGNMAWFEKGVGVGGEGNIPGLGASTKSHGRVRLPAGPSPLSFSNCKTGKKQALGSWPQPIRDYQETEITSEHNPTQLHADIYQGLSSQNPSFPTVGTGHVVSGGIPTVPDTGHFVAAVTQTSGLPLQNTAISGSPQFVGGYPQIQEVAQRLATSSKAFLTGCCHDSEARWQHDVPSVMPWTRAAVAGVLSSFPNAAKINLSRGSMDGSQYQRKRRFFSDEDFDMEYLQPSRKEQATEEKMTARMSELTLNTHMPPVDTTVQSVQPCTTSGKEKEDQEGLPVKVDFSPELLRSIAKNKPLLPRKVLEQIMVAELPPSMEMVLWKPPGDFIRNVVGKDSQHRKAVNSGRSTFVEDSCPLASEGFPCDLHMADNSFHQKDSASIEENLEDDMDL